MDKTKLSLFEELVKGSSHAVFFGGAGVSTASGIPDFRSASGVYNEKYGSFRPEEIVSADFFYRRTEDFYRFYREKMLFPNARPNAAHLKLAEWEREGYIKSVITQNIDGLHQSAGSKEVIELHGSALRNYCLSCGKEFSLEHIVRSEGVPVCDRCGGLIKPDVVLYGEQLKESDLERASDEIAACDVLIVGGTSLAVYPAAAFVYSFKGKDLIVINNSTTGADESATLVFREDIAAVFASL